MAKIEDDIVATLMADIGSPRVVAAIQRAIEATAQQHQELVELKKMAVRRHGENPVEAEASAKSNDFAMSFGFLIQQYRTDPESGFHQLRFKTRENYESQLRRLENEMAGDMIASFDEDRIEQKFEEWSGGGARLPMARALLGMVRRLATFGSTVLKSRDCRELKLTLHDMRFETPTQANNERLTREQAEKIIDKAHEMGLSSIAVAQAFQFDCGLKQKDVIGEWVPRSEPGESDVIDNETNMKWLRGLRWEQIDDNLVLRHVTSQRGEAVELPLKDAPLVLAMISGRKKSNGPIIIAEKTGKPYLTHTFRRTWRVVADAGRLLRPRGWLLIEVGGDQDRALAGTLAATGFDIVEPWWDDDGDLRGLAAQLRSPVRVRVAGPPRPGWRARPPAAGRGR